MKINSKGIVNFIRFFGWFLFMLSSCIVIGGVIANSGEAFELGLIGFFMILGINGFVLTRFRKEKNATSDISNQVIQPTTNPSSETGKSIYENKIFHILYQDTHSETTERDIEIMRIDKRGDNFYFYAFCYLRNSVQTFSVDRIITMEFDGQEVDIQEFLQQGEFSSHSANGLADLAMGA